MAVTEPVDLEAMLVDAPGRTRRLEEGETSRLTRTDRPARALLEPAGPGGVRLCRGSECFRSKHFDVGGLGRHADGLAQWQASSMTFKVATGSGMIAVGSTFLWSRDESDSGQVWESGRPLAVRRGARNSGGPCFSENHDGGGIRPRRLAGVRDGGRGEIGSRPFLFQDLKGPGLHSLSCRGQGGGRLAPSCRASGRNTHAMGADQLGPLPPRPRSPRATSRSWWRPGREAAHRDHQERYARGLEIEDADAHRIRIPRDQIEDRKRSDVSLMPTGLAEGLSKQDFADLIAYLETLKETSAKNPSK